MGISDARAHAHIQEWTDKLGQVSSLSYRVSWPKYLFRHEPLENAARIIRSGALYSRNDAQALEHDDIAPAGVIGSRLDAHNFSRLYFRPRNPTQFRVEGVRREDELYLQDRGAHAPMIVMFVFSSYSVMTLPDTNFSSGNMQSYGSVYGTGDEFFNTINFANVFHDSAFSADERERIVKARCAEVLAASPLSLNLHLKGILCRSQAEKSTLLHLAGSAANSLRSRVKVFSEVGIFFNRYAFVKSVELSQTGLKILLNPRFDSADIALNIEVTKADGTTWLARRVNSSYLTKGDKNIVYRRHADDGDYLVKIWLEDKLAYSAGITVNSLPF